MSSVAASWVSGVDDASTEDFVALIKHQRLSRRRSPLGFVEFDKNHIACLDMNHAGLVSLPVACFCTAVHQ